MRVVVSVCLLAVLSCSDPPGPGRTRVPACDPLLGIQLPTVRGYYLTRIDGATLPQALTFGSGTYQIAAGQLALDVPQRSYLTAFYTDAANPRFGISIIGGQNFEQQPDGTLNLLVSSDSVQVFGVVSISTDSLSLELVITDRPDPGNAIHGAHDLEYVRCP